MLLALLLAIPVGINAQGKKITLKLNKVALPTALRQVEQQSGYYKINYPYDEMRGYTVSANVKDATAPHAVNALLEGLPFTASVDGQFILITRSTQKTAQTKKNVVRGRLLDSDGEPLIGVAVQVEGTNKGTVTDYDGNYVLEDVTENDMLTFSYVGKRPLKRKASYKPSVIILEDDNAMLEDVVVTGYQTISRERSAGSYGIVKGDDISSKVNLTNNVLSSLEGMTTGLSVNNSSGADKFTIRGITSINSTRSPLYVVDGVPLEESQLESLLNNNDIESITLLKDATAASIWGSQAANGVVVITTKKGKKSDKIHVTYNGSFTYTGKPDYSYQKMMDGETFMRNAQEMFDQYKDTYAYEQVQTGTVGLNKNVYPIIVPHEHVMYQYAVGEINQSQRDAALQQLISQDGRKDYEENFMSNQLMTRHSLSLSSGTDKASHYLSLGYVGNQGTAKDWSDRFTFNAKEEYKFNDKIKWDITLNASYGKEKAHLSPWTNLAVDNLYSYNTAQTNLPYATFFDTAGNAIDWSVYAVSAEKRESIEGMTGIDMSFFPVEDFIGSSNNTISTNVRVNTGLTIDLLKGLRYEGRIQYSRFHSKNEKFYPETTWRVREEMLCSTPANTLKPILPTSGGYFYLDNGVTSDWTIRNQLSYDNMWGDGKHQIVALAGTEIREYKLTSYDNFLRGYDMQTMKYNPYDEYNLSQVRGVLMGTAANTFTKTHYTQSEIMRRYFSLYANAAYTLMGRYTLNASLRFDQSNLFGSDPDTQYKPIWAVGGSWKISEEDFMKDLTWLNRLVLRATYGFAGNSPEPGQGGKYDILTATQTSSFFEKVGMSITTPANDKITWEKTRTWNFGFDADFLHNRLGISFDYYDKKTTDLISNMLLNPFTGWLSTIGNVGTLRNKGVELAVNAHIIKSQDFNWNTTFTLSHNKNKIEKLDVSTPYTAHSLVTLASKNVEGYPVNSLFSYRYAGLNEKGEPMAYDKDGNKIDGVGSRSLEKEDAVFSGTIVPKVYGGLTNRFSYKDWDLSFMLVYNFGHKMRKQCENLQYGRPTTNMLDDYDNRWRKAGDETSTDIPAWNVSNNQLANYNIYYYSDTNVLDASYIKLRDITLAYSLPTVFCQKLSVQGIKLKLQVGNLFCWHANHEGIDPEYYVLDAYYDNRQDKFGPSYAVELNINF